MTFRKECEKYLFPTINKFQLLASYFNVIFTSKPIHLFWSIQSIIMIYFLEYITYLNTSIKIHRIKTYLYVKNNNENTIAKTKICHSFNYFHLINLCFYLNKWHYRVFLIQLLRVLSLQKLQFWSHKMI